MSEDIEDKSTTGSSLHWVVILYVDIVWMCICKSNTGAPYTLWITNDCPVVNHRNNRKSYANHCHLQQLQWLVTSSTGETLF